MRAEVPKEIDKLDWQNASGITKEGKKGTNTMLAERDYSVKCDITGDPLMIVHGVWIWFCKSHHQPLSHCEHAIAEEKSLSFANTVLVSDKTDSYEYGGEDALNNKRQPPPTGARWLSPKELARDFIAYIKR